MSYYNLPEGFAAEIDHLESAVERFRDGSLHPVEFRGIRVPFGIYEQRTSGTYMVRIRCTGGAVTPAQLTAVADLADRFGNDHLHVTTRQELQIHGVVLDNIMPVVRGLAAAGLSSRGGGGNTVRNIIASYDSGTNPQEVFDVLPYVSALTDTMIARGDSWVLPRKYKIAFSAGPGDRANATVQDLGFIAREKDGEPGFRVFVAGGMGAKPAPGHELLDFVPGRDVYRVAAAIRNLFDKHGNRKNKHAARLRFLYKELGAESFRELFDREYDGLVKEPAYDLVPAAPMPALPPVSGIYHPGAPEETAWRDAHVTQQKQAGYYGIRIPLRLGDLRTDDARKLAGLAGGAGDDTIRFSMDQNVHLRNIPCGMLAGASQTLTGLDILHTGHPVTSALIACTGAATCKLGICLPRGLARELYGVLGTLEDPSGILDGYRIHVSGCPNSCGQHHTADLGFFGVVGRSDGNRSYPAYRVVAAARLVPGKTRLAAVVGTIPAKRVPDFARSVFVHLADQGVAAGDFAAYFDREGRQALEKLVKEYTEVPAYEDDSSFYTDWGAAEEFTTTRLGQGECTAGLFDMIDVDREEIRHARTDLDTALHAEQEAQAVYTIARSAARMLLVTKGIEAGSDGDVFTKFSDAFIGTGLIPDRFSQVTAVGAAGDRAGLTDRKADVLALADAVQALYDRMDNSLRFPGEHDAAADQAAPAVARDYRGVACPMNFVKTKMDLATMQPGQVLEILLDDGEPVENVPRSVEGEGHRILEQVKDGDHWKVVIKKG